MENAAYYGDIVEKNFAQCEEIHKIYNLTGSIAKQGGRTIFLAPLRVAGKGLSYRVLCRQKGLEIMCLTSGKFAGVLEKEYKAPQRLNAKGLKRKHTLFSFSV